MNTLRTLLLAFFTITASFLFAQNTTYPQMILVEGGTFNMGDTEMEGKKNERPVHEVTVSTFSISKYPITRGQFKVYSKATGKPMPKLPDEWHDEDELWFGEDDDYDRIRFVQDDHPVVNVSWHEAVAYTEWLSDKMDKNYRLPTEAEWEYAARGGIQSKGYKYAGGNNLDAVGWSDISMIQTVGRLRPNELGIYDMSGNVLEWCRDWYDKDYYANSPKNNPKGPVSGSYRVLRGGGWRSSATDCRVAKRDAYIPSYRYEDFSFRVLFSHN